MHRLIILILFFSWVSTPVSLDAGPIDYFDITRPKFKPLPVVIRMNPANHLQGLYVQSVFQSNLEQTLFFRVYEENSLPESLIKGNEPPAFTMILQILEENPLKFRFELFGREQETALASGELRENEKTDLRELGLQMANTFIKNSLGFRGIAQSRIAYTSQKKNGRKNIMLSSYDGTHQQRFSYNLGSNNYASWAFDNQNLLYTTFTRSKVQVAIQPSKRLRASILSFPEGTQPQGGTWSPSGDSILITLMTKGNSDIYNYHLKTRKLDRIIAWKSLETSPSWSKDASSIVFVSDSVRFQQPQIYIHDTKTKKPGGSLSEENTTVPLAGHRMDPKLFMKENERGISRFSNTHFPPIAIFSSPLVVSTARNRTGLQMGSRSFFHQTGMDFQNYS